MQLSLRQVKTGEVRDFAVILFEKRAAQPLGVEKIVGTTQIMNLNDSSVSGTALAAGVCHSLRRKSPVPGGLLI